MIFKKIILNFFVKLKYIIFKIPKYYYLEYLKEIKNHYKFIDKKNISFFLKKNKFFEGNNLKVSVFASLIYSFTQDYLRGATPKIQEYELLLNKEKLNFNWQNNYLLHKLYFFIGLTELSFFHRNNYEKFFLNKEFKLLNIYEKFIYFKIIFENCEIEKVYKIDKKFFDNFILKKFFKNEYKSSLFIFNILKKNLNYFKNFKNDFNFKKYIENKSIAIIGPSNNEDFNINDLDYYDVIVQPNIFDENNLYDLNKSISYYSKFSTSKIILCIDQNRFDLFNKLQFTCVKGRSDKIKKKIKNSRQFDLKLNLVSGSEQLLQYIISDLIKFNPKKIKIFSTDFYLNEKTYNPNYSGNKVRNTNYLERKAVSKFSLSFHDLMSQIKFVKTFEKLGYIEVDDFTKNFVHKNYKELENLIISSFKETYKIADVQNERPKLKI